MASADSFELKAGWISDATLGGLVRAQDTVFRELSYVLISSVDSNDNVAGMPWVRRRLTSNPQWALSIAPLVIHGSTLVDVANSGEVFFGFDEIWVLRDLPASPPPPEAYIVAPRRLSEEIPHKVAEWIRDWDVRLGLGDGDGLNFAGKDHALLRRLGLV